MTGLLLTCRVPTRIVSRREPSGYPSPNMQTPHWAGLKWPYEEGAPYAALAQESAMSDDETAHPQQSFQNVRMMLYILPLCSSTVS